MSRSKIAIISPYPVGEEWNVGFSALAGYTKSLLLCFGQDNKKEFIVIAQKENAVGKSNNSGNVQVLNVWDYNKPWFFLQILFRLITLRIKLVHLQHEVYVFGKKQYVYPYLCALLLFLLKLFGIKVVTTVHGVVSLEDLNRNFSSLNGVSAPMFLIKFGLKSMYSLTCRFSDIVIVHNENLKSTLNRDYHIDRNKIFVVHIPLYKFSYESVIPKELEEIPEDIKNVVLFFGFLAPYKGLDKLIEAARMLDLEKLRTALLIVGSTPKRHIEDENYLLWLDNLKNKSSDCANIEWVHKFVPDTELKSYFDRSDLVVIPYTEALSASAPLSLAVSNGTNVIVSDVFKGVIQEDLIYGSTARDLCNAIKKFILDETYRSKVKKATSYQKVLWSDDVIRSKMTDIYNSLFEKTNI